MNSAELLVLAYALYGHDWGMAVSEQEKAYIVKGDATDKEIQDVLGDPEEHRQFLTYAKEHLLIVAENTLYTEAGWSSTPAH